MQLLNVTNRLCSSHHQFTIISDDSSPRTSLKIAFCDLTEILTNASNVPTMSKPEELLQYFLYNTIPLDFFAATVILDTTSRVNVWSIQFQWSLQDISADRAESSVCECITWSRREELKKEYWCCMVITTVGVCPGTLPLLVFLLACLFFVFSSTMA